MIRKLKRKFIFVNMALVFLVLLIVFFVLCFSTYQRQNQTASASLSSLMQRRDGEPEAQFEIGRPSGKTGSHAPGSDLTAGFVVTIDEDGEQTVSTSGQVSVSDDTAAGATALALEAKADSGLLRPYSLRYLRVVGETETRIAFLDASADLSSMAELIATSLLVGALGLGAFFFISLFLANWALRPAETAWQRQKQFVADASHELKTPLTVILANQKILLSHPDQTVREQAQWVENTQSEGNRMKSLVEDMLFLAKADAERTAETFSEVNLSDVVQSALLSFASVAFEAGVETEDDIQPDVSCPGSEAQLRRLCGILFDNAIKYAGRGGSVRVRLAFDGAACRLTVRNTGAPIPERELPHLFERFYRADRARSAGGFGLGLSIAESIARSHGGRISVSSTAAEGTAFTVTLPIRAPYGKNARRKPHEA